MNVATLKDDTDRSIRKELWIRYGISKTRLQAAEVAPQLCEFTVYKKGNSVAVRDELAISKMQHLATIAIVSETRPSPRPTIRRTHKCRELFATEVAAIGEKDTVKLMAGVVMEEAYLW
jgi:hypothetical protein